MTASTRPSPYSLEGNPPLFDDQSVMSNYNLTPEETRVLSQCERDSFIYRSLPMMFISGCGVQWAIKNGRLKPNPVMGAVPKMIGAMALSYILGRVSYINNCAERLMNIPNSPLGDQIRRKKGLEPRQSFEGFSGSSDRLPTTDNSSGFGAPGPVHQEAPFSDGAQAQFRPDNGQKRSFEELRNENRLRYAHSLYSRKQDAPPQHSSGPELFGSPQPSEEPPTSYPPAAYQDPPNSDRESSASEFARPAPQPRAFRSEPPKSGRKNAYGDSWEE